MSWWDRHYRDPKPAKDCKNLCARCLNGYPIEEFEGPYYCKKLGIENEIITSCDNYKRQFSCAVLSASEFKKAKASYEPISDEHFCIECVRYTYDPKRKPEPWCCAYYGPEVLEFGRVACKNFWDRGDKEEADRLEAERREKARQEAWKQNKNNPPRPADMKRDYDEMTGGLTGAMPFCPNCGNPLYEIDQCYFCGQKILMDDALKKWADPPEEQTMDCFQCGGKGTLHYVTSRYNGHKHGECIACGMRFME